MRLSFSRVDKRQDLVVELLVARCCCDDYTKLQMALMYQKKDLKYQQERVPNLKDQVEHLRSWCSVRTPGPSRQGSTSAR